MVKPQVLEQFKLYFPEVSFHLLLATERLSICKTAAMSLTPRTFEMAYIIVKHLRGCAHVTVFVHTVGWLFMVTPPNISLGLFLGARHN